MIVTLNEVQRTCQKALFGAGVPAGLDDDAAQATAWLEARGVPALAALAAALERGPADVVIGDIVQSAATRIDAGGRSAIFLGLGLVEMAAGRAGRGGSARLSISALRDPRLLVAYAEGLRASGWRFEIAWPGGGGVLDPAGGVSLHGDWDAPLEDAREVAIRCARDGAEGFEIDLPLTCGSDELAARARATLSSGLRVSAPTWRTIAAFAQRALVPASAESRARGAGAAASDNE